MLPDRVSNPGPLTYESGALSIALRGPATPIHVCKIYVCKLISRLNQFSVRSLGAETRTQKNSPHKCLIQILII